jgi:hypothetical protein
LSPFTSPNLLNTRTLVSSVVTIALGSVGSLGGKALVHVTLDVVAVADGFVKESAGVALVEGCHDLLAVCDQMC